MRPLHARAHARTRTHACVRAQGARTYTTYTYTCAHKRTHMRAHTRRQGVGCVSVCACVHLKIVLIEEAHSLSAPLDARFHDGQKQNEK